MCRAPHYQICSFETDQPDLPLVDFAELGLDCQMVILSAHAARLIITSIRNPFAGLVQAGRSKFGKLKVTAIDYCIYAERANGEFVTQGFRHEFPKPADLKGDVIEARPHKLFKLEPLGDLLRSRAFAGKEFSCTKGVQFIA